MGRFWLWILASLPLLVLNFTMHVRSEKIFQDNILLSVPDWVREDPIFSWVWYNKVWDRQVQEYIYPGSKLAESDFGQEPPIERFEESFHSKKSNLPQSYYDKSVSEWILEMNENTTRDPKSEKQFEGPVKKMEQEIIVGEVKHDPLSYNRKKQLEEDSPELGFSMAKSGEKMILVRGNAPAPQVEQPSITFNSKTKKRIVPVELYPAMLGSEPFDETNPTSEAKQDHSGLIGTTQNFIPRQAELYPSNLDEQTEDQRIKMIGLQDQNQERDLIMKITRIVYPTDPSQDPAYIEVPTDQGYMDVQTDHAYLDVPSDFGFIEVPTDSASTRVKRYASQETETSAVLPRPPTKRPSSPIKNRATPVEGTKPGVLRRSYRAVNGNGGSENNTYEGVCGSNFTNLFRNICRRRVKRSVDSELAISATSAHIRRNKRSIYIECCRRQCTQSEIIRYCP